MKPKSNPFLSHLALVGVSFALGTSANADIFDVNSTTAGFGVSDGSTYDWLDATGFWADTTTVNDGTAATVAWQGTASVSEQAYFIGSGTAGQNYTVRLGATGATDVYIQNLAINVLANGSAVAPSTAGNVTIGNAGDAGNLILRAANSAGAQNNGTLTINNGVNLNAQTLNYRGGNVVINGSVSGTGTSNISSSSGAFGLTSGTLTLVGDNSFAGNTSVGNNYIFRLQHANALGAVGGTNTVVSGGAMEVAGGVTISSGESVILNGGSANFFGALRAGSGGGTWAGGVSLGDNAVRIGALADQTLTVTGSIANGTSGNGFNVSGQNGTGVVLLNPTTSNTYTGTTGVLRGILRLGKTNALPTGTTLDVDSVSSVTDAATFDMAGFNQTVAALQDSAAINVNGLITNSVAATTSTLTVNQASNTSYDSIIQNGSGSVALTKSGVGNLTLNGANTFTGGTNIENGKIIIGGGNNRLATGGSVNIGSVSTTGALVVGDGTARTQTLAGLTTSGLGGAVVGGAAANSSLTLSNTSGTNTFGGTLGGAGTNENNLSLAKNGLGTLNLTGANTYNGGTTITQGILQVGVASVGTVGSITSSAIGTGTLIFSGGTISSNSTTARTILNAVTYSTASTFGDATNNGKLTFSADVNLGTAQKTMTVHSDVQFDGKISGALGGISLGTSTGFGKLTLTNTTNDFTGAVGLAANSGTLRITSSGALGVGPKTVTNTGASNLVPVTGANLLELDSNGGSDISLASDISFSTSGSAGVILNTAGNNTIAGNFNMTSGNGNTRIISNGGTLTLSGTFTSNATDRELDLTGSTTGNIFSGALVNGTNTALLTKNGAGTWTVSGASNTFTGRTKVNAGTLALTNNLAIQNSAFDTSGAGTLDTSTINTPTFGGLTSATDYAVSSNVTSLTLKPVSGATHTYTGNLSGGASGMTLTKTGAGTQVLGGTSSYSGLTTVNGGELQISNEAAIGGTNVTVTSGQLALSGGITVSGKSLTTSGSGSNFYGGLQSATGTNTWNGGVLLGADNSRVGARLGAILVMAGAVDDGANTYNFVVRNQNQNNTSGAGNNATITEISGINTYGGNTQLIAGVTRLGGGDNRLPTGTILQFGGSGANAKFDMNGRNQEVAGLAVMNINNDTQRDWNANELTNSSGTLSTLTVNAAADQTFGLTTTSFSGSANYTGVITGNIALQKTGSASLTLTSANTYSGATTINAGTLALGAAGSIDNTSGVALGGGIFDVSAKLGGYTVNNLTGSGSIVGAITVSTTLAIGNSPGEISFGGDLALGTSTPADFNYEFTGGGVAADIGIVSGNLSLDSKVFLNLFQLGSYNLGDTFTLFAYDGSVNGTFIGLAEGDTTTDNLGGMWRINYGESTAGDNYFGSPVSGGFVNITAVPEPNVAALLGALGTLILLRRRRA
jgi:autotransporter-associated beta strand protein